MQIYQRKNRAFIKVEGEDAEKFLNNLLSQNLKLCQQNPQQAFLSCLLNQKGGVEAYFWVSLSEGGFCLDMHTTMVDNVINILNQYKLRMKVAFKAMPEQHSYFAFKPLSTSIDCIEHQIKVNQLVLYKYEIASSKEDDLLKSIEYMSDDLWNIYRIAQIWPKWQQDVEPGMLVLQSDFLKQGVALDKGCYLGQETVARVHARGERVARKLLSLKAPLNSLQVGNTLYKSNEDKVIGSVSSVGHDQVKQEDWALAMIDRAALAEERLISNTSVEVKIVQ
ncbi:MAG TPA: hypothetical protein PKC21_08050 [Oligoflexia bacterium]|nr:hypothetical protein [Oligoflexia bacterium]HMR25290.1 hypothetical protein [Oligoflexia bacterium]